MNVEQMMIPGCIDHRAEREVIAQRVTDGYINATAMCKAAGKQWKDYMRLATTKPFLDELSSVVSVAHHGLIRQTVVDQTTANMAFLST